METSSQAGTVDVAPFDAVPAGEVSIETAKHEPHRTSGMRQRGGSLHWPEYLIEAGALGAFMVSAAVFAVVLYHPSSPVASSLSSEWWRRGWMGLAMGTTAVVIIYSPWGQRSGAHMNPAITLTFYRLGRVPGRDLVGYVASQFLGGVMGIALVAAALGSRVAHPSVNYVTTTPGAFGEAGAFLGEGIISFGMMLTVLSVSIHPKLARFTGLCAGFLVGAYIVFEAPLSGMSMNPARTFGSAVLAWNFTGLWIYFVAPPLGMFLAAELFTRRYGLRRIICAKLHHPHDGPCIFGCRERAAAAALTKSA
jgi:aquaporin Z